MKLSLQIAPNCNIKKVFDSYIKILPVIVIYSQQEVYNAAKSVIITDQVVNYLKINKFTVYIKDCALFFVTHGQRPQLVTPLRQPGSVHPHQQVEPNASEIINQENPPDNDDSSQGAKTFDEVHK